MRHPARSRGPGPRTGAVGPLSTSRPCAERLGGAPGRGSPHSARVYVERCDRELKTGRSGSRLQDGDLDTLTEQERTIAGLVARWLANREVAAEILLSVKTVQYHLTRTYSKLGVRSRAELAAHFPRASQP
ncbi:helix-turn-helix domain-containing protein [Pseudonocardia pini]|uniref:helix-turn-helix domain-containing protein n=1 Tax=Pseudonocardia pini TaxID=2758030 RepID=UPI0028B0578E|nr:helix-turn-helix transcriptional regulator [Pseudonocardia pini]